MSDAGKVDIVEARSELKEFYGGLHSLFDQVKADNDKGQVASAYPEFIREAPASYLERASDRLAKKSYKIGVAGVFSAGKSTLVNAVLGEPDLLPTQAGECTMSITIVVAPKPGDGEHVKVYYFAKEDALKYVFNNPRYKVLLSEYLSDVMTPSFSEEKAVMAIKQGAQKAGKDPNQREKKKELVEFLEAMETHKDRLGSVWADDMKNVAQYLTTDAQDRGMGHLLLIEQVHIHKNNELFTHDGFEIIDLPGTDSTNDRQRELTHGYLMEADAVLNIIEPKGIAQAGKEIFEKMGQYNNDVKNKMFFVMNMFDKVPLSEIGKDDVERVIRAQVLGKLIDFGLDTDKFFLTSAKYQDLQNRKDKGIISNTELKELENIMTDCNAKLNALDRTIEPRILEMMEICYKDGGVMNFKKNLMRYLKYDIQVERLFEIFTDLNRVYRASKTMLDAEETKIRQLKESSKSATREIQEFFDTTKDAFFDKVNLINKGVEKVVQKGMESVRDKLAKSIANFIDKFNIDRVTRGMTIKTPRDIKLTVIDHLKPTLSNRFGEMVRETLPLLISGKLVQLTEESRVGEVIEKLAADLGTNWHQKYREMIHGFETDINRFTYMRALEETWHIQDTAIQIQAGGPAWSEQIEQAFKEDLKKLFVKEFVEYAQRLTGLLGRHYKVLVNRLIDDFEALIDGVSGEIKQDPDRVTLPAELLTGEGEDNEQDRINRALLSYDRAFEPIVKLQARLQGIFEGQN